MYSKALEEGQLGISWLLEEKRIVEKVPKYKTTIWGKVKPTGTFENKVRVLSVEEKVKQILQQANKHLDELAEKTYWGSPYARSAWFSEEFYLTPSNHIVPINEIELIEDERVIYNFLRFNVFDVKKRSRYCYSIDEIQTMVELKLKRKLEECEKSDLEEIIIQAIRHSKINNKEGQKITVMDFNNEAYFIYPDYEEKNFYNELSNKVIKKEKSFSNNSKTYSSSNIKELQYGVCGIYKITNKKNGLSYIGQATDIRARWESHLKAKGTNKLYTAMRVDGINNFVFSVVEECPAYLLDVKECEYIEKYNTCLFGYNSNRGPVKKAAAVKASLS